MSKIWYEVPVVAALLFGCAGKTVFYDVNPRYESYAFSAGAIAVCPFSGTWKVDGNDTVLNRLPGVEKYAFAIADRIAKKRKCLTVVQPNIVAARVPAIESIAFKHRLLYQKMTPGDSVIFDSLRIMLQADYLIIFERAFFSMEHQPNDPSNSLNSLKKKTTLVFQIWDLKNRQFMYRGETKGSGLDKMDSQHDFTGKQSIKDTAEELVKALPGCE